MPSYAVVATKINLVTFLAAAFKDKGHAVQQAVDDADTVIVSAAFELAQTTEVTVVANDTDIIVLLVYHFKPLLNNVYLHSEVSTRNSNRTTLWSIHDIHSVVSDKSDSEEIFQEQGETVNLYEEMSDERLELVVPSVIEEVV